MSGELTVTGLEFIEKVETINTGGNCHVDLVHLKDGRVLGVTDESVVVYPSREHFDCNEGYELEMLEPGADMLDLTLFPPPKEGE